MPPTVLTDLVPQPALESEAATPCHPARGEVRREHPSFDAVKAEPRKAGSCKEVHGLRRVALSAMLSSDPISHFGGGSLLVDMMESDPTEDAPVGPPYDGEFDRPTRSPVHRGATHPLPAVARPERKRCMARPPGDGRFREQTRHLGNLVEGRENKVDATAA